VTRAAGVLALSIIATPVARAQTVPAPAAAAPAPPAPAAPVAPTPMAAEPPAAVPAVPASSVPALPYSLTVDATITGAAIVGWVGSELLKGQLAPSTCRWCDPPGFDSSVRDALRWNDTERVNVISYVVPLGVEPLVVFGLDALAAHDAKAPPRAAWVDGLLISEATAIAMAMNQAVKFVVGRERPFVHALDEADKPNTAHPSDNNVSFYSGHSTFAFAMAVSGGTVASMRGYRLAPWIWGAGLTIAAVSAYLRIAAERHYFSDVMTGSIIGSLTGFAVPYLFHNPARRVMVAPAPLDHGGAGFAVRGHF
jgi:membrane-associated phospholipid phosphatase